MKSAWGLDGLAANSKLAFSPSIGNPRVFYLFKFFFWVAPFPGQRARGDAPGPFDCSSPGAATPGAVAFRRGPILRRAPAYWRDESIRNSSRVAGIG